MIKKSSLLLVLLLTSCNSMNFPSNFSSANSSPINKIDDVSINFSKFTILEKLNYVINHDIDQYDISKLLDDSETLDSSKLDFDSLSLPVIEEKQNIMTKITRNYKRKSNSNELEYVDEIQEYDYVENKNETRQRLENGIENKIKCNYYDNQNRIILEEAYYTDKETNIDYVQSKRFYEYDDIKHSINSYVTYYDNIGNITRMNDFRETVCFDDNGNLLSHYKYRLFADNIERVVYSLENSYDTCHNLTYQYNSYINVPNSVVAYDKYLFLSSTNTIYYVNRYDSNGNLKEVYSNQYFDDDVTNNVFRITNYDDKGREVYFEKDNLVRKITKYEDSINMVISSEYRTIPHDLYSEDWIIKSVLSYDKNDNIVLNMSSWYTPNDPSYLNNSTKECYLYNNLGNLILKKVFKKSGFSNEKLESKVLYSCSNQKKYSYQCDYDNDNNVAATKTSVEWNKEDSITIRKVFDKEQGDFKTKEISINISTENYDITNLKNVDFSMYRLS